MKKITILFSISFFIYSNVYSQSDYYWSSNTKNYLVVDSTTVLIKTNNPIKTPIRNTNFQNISGLNIETKYLDSTHVFLQALNKISLNNISTGLTNQNLKATDLLYAYTYNKSKIIPTGTIVLKNKKGVSIEQIINLIGGSQIEKYHSDPYGNVYIIPKKLKGLFQLANTIYESGLVEFCHPDFICDIRHANVIYDKKKAKASSGTNDAYYNNQYYLKNTGQNGGTSGVDINIEDAWALPSLNAPVRVAVIDNGVESHEDLAGKLVSGYTTSDPNGYGAPEFSTDYHGQACAGIIAATKNNGIGISGISNAVIVPINIFYLNSSAS
jgi:hypothetical protein